MTPEELETAYKDFRARYAKEHHGGIVDSVLIPRIECFKAGYELAVSHSDVEADGRVFCGLCGHIK